MKEIGDLKLYSFDEIKDEFIGVVGTKEREEHDKKVEEAVQAYKIGEAIKKARIQQQLTQQELGDRIGVKKSRISRIEKGEGLTLPTMGRVFKALGVPSASVNIENVGRVILW